MKGGKGVKGKEERQDGRKGGIERKKERKGR